MKKYESDFTANNYIYTLDSPKDWNSTSSGP